MTTAQSIFVVFFAIFWGAVFNVQGRWKMFQAFCGASRTYRRVLLAFLMCNVLPVLYFAVATYWLRVTSTTHASTWGFWETVQQVLAGVLPAFAIFGFYRLWIWAVQWLGPECFYQNKGHQPFTLKEIEPTIEELGLNPPLKPLNGAFALLYFAIAATGLLLR